MSEDISAQMGIEDTSKMAAFVAVGRRPQLLTRTSMHRTALVSSWRGNWVPPEQGILENKMKITTPFIPPSAVRLRDFCNALLLLEIYPGRWRELRNCMSTRRDPWVIWEAVYHNVCTHSVHRVWEPAEQKTLLPLH